MIAQQVKEVHALGVDVMLVIGGGNFFRGAEGEKSGIDRATGDHIGMLATVMNGLALQDAIERAGATATRAVFFSGQIVSILQLILSPPLTSAKM